jgi:hypothetical protein
MGQLRLFAPVDLTHNRRQKIAQIVGLRRDVIGIGFRL